MPWSMQRRPRSDGSRLLDSSLPGQGPYDQVHAVEILGRVAAQTALQPKLRQRRPQRRRVGPIGDSNRQAVIAQVAGAGPTAHPEADDQGPPAEGGGDHAGLGGRAIASVSSAAASVTAQKDTATRFSDQPERWKW